VIDFDPVRFFTMIGVILLGLSIHEFAHAKLADVAGDPTPRIYGRVTLNPLSHLDPTGTIMIFLSSLTGFGIGWGRPVPMNPGKMKNPRWDHFAAVAAGPLSNLVQATIYAVLLRVLLQTGSVSPAAAELALGFGGFLPFLLVVGVFINVALCLFNLIPLGPLDGHWLVGAFLPEPSRIKWYLWNRQAGGFVLLMVIIIGQMNPQFNLIGTVLLPVSQTIFRFLVGV